MKLVQQYGSYTITTTITKDQIAKAKRYAPKSLTLMEDKTPVFAVDSGKTGSISKNGITFNSVSNDGTLYVTCPCVVAESETPAQIKAKLEEDFGMILFNLKQVEDQVNTAVEAAAATIASVSEAIVIG